MPRAGATALLAGTLIRPAVFVQLGFISSIEYVWSGRGQITWNGQTWQGVGDLGAISTVVEDSGLTAQGLTISMSNIRAGLAAEVLTEVQQGLPAKVWLVFMDDTCTPISSLGCYMGRMDQPTINEGADSDTVDIAIENRLSDLQRAPFHRLTDQDQRMTYPNDDGLKFVQSLQEWDGSWGSK